MALTLTGSAVIGKITPASYSVEIHYPAPIGTIVATISADDLGATTTGDTFPVTFGEQPAALAETSGVTTDATPA